MLDTFITAFGLGIAGIDPLGAIILMRAIAANFTRAKIVFFNITVLISAILAGTILSVVGSGFITGIKDVLPGNSSSAWVFVNLIIAAITIAWIVRRKKKKDRPNNEKPSKTLGSSYYAIAATGLLFGAGSVFDPTFLATISLAAQTNDLPTILLMHTIWIITSQFMLFVLFIAYLKGKHEKVIDFSRMQYTKHKVVLQDILSIAAIGVVIFLVADSLSFVIRGEYLVNL